MEINVFIKEVKPLSNTTKNIKNDISSIESNVNNTRRSLPVQILNRNNIDSELNSIVHRLHRVEVRLGKIETFIKTSMEEYEDCEYKIKKEAEKILNEDKTLFYKLKDSLFDEVKGAVLGFNPRDYLIAGGFFDYGFKLFKDEETGQIFIKLKNKSFTNNSEFMKIRDKLTEYLGGTSKWNKSFVNDLTNGKGVLLFDTNSNKKFNSNINKFTNSGFDELAKQIEKAGKGLDKTAWQKVGSGFVDGWKEGLDIADDFKGWKGATTTTKVTKGLGIVSTAMTVGSNLDNFVDDNGKIEVNASNTVDFIVDTGVDIGAGAVATGVGSAVGSLFLPPLGTIVGAGVGMAVGTMLNTPFFGDKSLVEDVKDGLNYVVDEAGKLVSNVFNGIGKQLADIFW